MKDIADDYQLVYNLTKDNLGPFNYSNLETGYLKVSSKWFFIINVVGFYSSYLWMVNRIQNKVAHS